MKNSSLFHQLFTWYPSLVLVDNVQRKCWLHSFKSTDLRSHKWWWTSCFISYICGQTHNTFVVVYYICGQTLLHLWSVITFVVSGLVDIPLRNSSGILLGSRARLDRLVARFLRWYKVSFDKCSLWFSINFTMEYIRKVHSM